MYRRQDPQFRSMEVDYPEESSQHTPTIGERRGITFKQVPLSSSAHASQLSLSAALALDPTPHRHAAQTALKRKSSEPRLPHGRPKASSSKSRTLFDVTSALSLTGGAALRAPAPPTVPVSLGGFGTRTSAPRSPPRRTPGRSTTKGSANSSMGVKGRSQSVSTSPSGKKKGSPLSTRTGRTISGPGTPSPKRKRSTAGKDSGIEGVKGKIRLAFGRKWKGKKNEDDLDGMRDPLINSNSSDLPELQGRTGSECPALEGRRSMQGGNNSNIDDPFQEIQVPPKLTVNGVDTDDEEPLSGVSLDSMSTESSTSMSVLEPGAIMQAERAYSARATLVMLPGANPHTPPDMTRSVVEVFVEKAELNEGSSTAQSLMGVLVDVPMRSPWSPAIPITPNKEEQAVARKNKLERMFGEGSEEAVAQMSWEKREGQKQNQSAS
ncbi:hypothetical protein NLJ89_g7886 [Agrocybe chaxingu]|uniref:Uncharacterized protein n=1 Tax=Agrocybe chaxingu TaxID=84603 RepID=A0A9W8K2S9_9AGAR|nr:hypothetical protein NLJ89_g7886 [Agrocybe chaxingu]